MGSLLWLSVGPLMTWGGCWMLTTSSCSRDMRGTDCCSGPQQCASSPCLCRAHMCKSCQPRSSRFLPQRPCVLEVVGRYV